MNEPDDYRKQAAECLAMAERATGETRAKLLEIAEAWLELAENGVAVVPSEPKPER
jgi:hypothetical protein